MMLSTADPGGRGRSRHEPADHGRYAIGLTWNVPRAHREAAERSRRLLYGRIVEFHKADRVAALLPFRHRPLHVSGGGGSWNGYWVLLLAQGAAADETWSELEPVVVDGAKSRIELIPRAEVLRIQPGIDMYYPHPDRLRGEPRWHWIEYVVSRPETRDEYYQDQYDFSGPAIRHFYDVGAIRRFIGFERVRHLANEGSLPEWDVVHIIGLSPLRLPRLLWTLLESKSYFDVLARKVGHRTALDVMRSWDDQRTKYQQLALQERSFTLQATQDATLVP